MENKNPNQNKRKYDKENSATIPPAARRILKEQQAEYKRIQKKRRDEQYKQPQAFYNKVTPFKPNPTYTLSQCYRDGELKPVTEEDWSWLDKIEDEHFQKENLSVESPVLDLTKPSATMGNLTPLSVTGTGCTSNTKIMWDKTSLPRERVK